MKGTRVLDTIARNDKVRSFDRLTSLDIGAGNEPSKTAIDRYNTLSRLSKISNRFERNCFCCTGCYRYHLRIFRACHGHKEYTRAGIGLLKGILVIAYRYSNTSFLIPG